MVCVWGGWCLGVCVCSWAGVFVGAGRGCVCLGGCVCVWEGVCVCVCVWEGVCVCLCVVGRGCLGAGISQSGGKGLNTLAAEISLQSMR